MNRDEALAFIEKHGIVLMSAHGPVPTLTDAIAGEPVGGSWWAHSKSHQMFALFGAVADSDDVVRCRLVKGKVTFVHRRLWPALVRLADRLPADGLAAIREEHTDRGSHRTIATPFPTWVPKASVAEGRRLSLSDALSALDPDLLAIISARAQTERRRALPARPHGPRGPRRPVER